MSTAPGYYVIKDTREQQGYFFGAYQSCLGMVEQKLDTGDYTIQGLEDKVCIERKSSVEELAINLGQKKYAFLDEIERMKNFEHKFLVLEFTLEDLAEFPKNTRIPADKISSVKITGKYILKCLIEFQLYNGVHVLFCGDKQHAFVTICSILKRINEKYTIGRQD
jgi:ERCC4-type nuclease